PPEYYLWRLRVVHDADRVVFLQQLVERLTELDVVLALLGGHRHRQHRRIGRSLGQRRMRLLAGSQRVAGIGVVELAERDRLARLRRGAFLVVLAEQLEYAGDAASLALGRNEGRAVADLAVEHARDRH